MRPDHERRHPEVTVSAVYWLRRDPGEVRPLSTPGYLLRSPLTHFSRFSTPRPYRLAGLQFACEYFSQSDADAHVTSRFTLFTFPTETVIPMQHHLIGPGGQMAGANAVANLVGEFVFLEFIVPY
jgi:hypothetical protein